MGEGQPRLCPRELRVQCDCSFEITVGRGITLVIESVHLLQAKVVV